MFPIEANEVKILINGQVRALRIYIAYSVFIILFGLLIMIFGNHWFVAGDQMKIAINLAGAAITTLTTFPLRQVNSCYDRITMFKLAESKLIELQTARIPKKKSESIKVEIFSTIQMIVEKNL